MVKISGATLIVALLLLSSPALADWAPGDPHKMHWPQLPDENGWDVRNTYYISVADDWECSESGLVTDLHIWTSWKTGRVGVIEFIHTAIYPNIPDPDEEGPLFSMPGIVPDTNPGEGWLWHKDWDPADFIFVANAGSGDQGWYDPSIPSDNRPDHTIYDQINFFIDPSEAFYQEQGTIYWLEVSIKLTLASYELGDRIGWKTTLDNWMDDAVWSEIVAGQDRSWNEIRDPETNESLDMAFVITPEPGTLSLLVLGGLGLFARASRRRR